MTTKGSKTAERGLSSDAKAKVLAMYREGFKLAEITDETKVPRATVYYLLEQAGIQPNRLAVRGSGALSLNDVMERLSSAEREVGELRAQLDKERIISRYMIELFMHIKTGTLPDVVDLGDKGSIVIEVKSGKAPAKKAAAPARPRNTRQAATG